MRNATMAPGDFKTGEMVVFRQSGTATRVCADCADYDHAVHVESGNRALVAKSNKWLTRLEWIDGQPVVGSHLFYMVDTDLLGPVSVVDLIAELE